MVCCDISGDVFAFIRRTQLLINQYRNLIKAKNSVGNKYVSYSRTLFINCCLGLLFIPRERSSKDVLFKTQVNSWGIETSSFWLPKGSVEELTVEELIRHMRNSLAHGRFFCHYNKRNVLTRISFKDCYPETEDLSFSGEMSYKTFETFVGLLADYTLDSQNK